MKAVQSRLALVIGAILLVSGLIAEFLGWHDLPMIIVGAVLIVSTYLEPIYGKLVSRPPLSGGWRPTGEKFVDPASGKPVEVWFDPDTGERRYVDIEGEKRQ